MVFDTKRFHERDIKEEFICCDILEDILSPVL